VRVRVPPPPLERDDFVRQKHKKAHTGRKAWHRATQGWVDAGFEGQITLELYNANSVPIRLYKGMRICQIVLARLDQPAERPYRGKYFGQRGATPSKIFVDFGI
jgi:dCTP deaminase